MSLFAILILPYRGLVILWVCLHVLPVRTGRRWIFIWRISLPCRKFAVVFGLNQRNPACIKASLV